MIDISTPAGLIGVLDMGASAIRLVVAEIDQKRAIRTIEEASRGVLLGRDTFSNGAIRSGRRGQIGKNRLTRSHNGLGSSATAIPVHIPRPPGIRFRRFFCTL